MAIYFSDEAQTRAAHIVNYATLTYTTRRSLSNNGTTEMLLADFGNYNKKESGSVLVFNGFCHGKNDANDFNTISVKIGASFDSSSFVVSGGTNNDNPSGGTYTYFNGNGSKLLMLHGQFTSYTTTGDSSILATYRSSANSGGGRPFALINPDANDSNHLATSMMGSRISIYEVLL